MTVRGKVIFKALLISLGVTFVSLAAVALYVVVTALTHAPSGGGVVVGGAGGLFLKLLLIEPPILFLLALLLLRRGRTALP